MAIAHAQVERAERRRATARRLRREHGWTVKQIAEHMGLSNGAVGKYVQGVEVQKRCYLCGSVFETITPARLTCSERCRNKYNALRRDGWESPYA